LASSPKARIVFALIAALAPVAALLVVLGATGSVAPVLAAGAIALSLVVGIGWAIYIGRTIEARAERLDAVAATLRSRLPPPHLLPENMDAMDRAEHRLLDAADAVEAEIGSLAEQRDEFEAMLRSMNEAVVVAGSRGEVVLLNGAARRLFALDAETEYRGRNFVELCRDSRLQEFVTRAMRSEGGTVSVAELAIQIPAPRYLAVNASQLRTSHGPCWVMVFHDITQLKAYETVRSDFIANLTHELRTPLSALYGYTETLMQGVDDAETRRRFLGIIDRQAHRLARLLDDLISLSDLERGVTPLKFENLDPAHVVEEAVELMRGQARRKGVNLEIKCESGLPKLVGDRDRLHQVLLNLIDNAIKYTPRDGRVTASASPATLTLNGAEPKPAVSLVVADTGEGIPAADIPRLTERFYRVDRARSRELGGTGLGLAIVKHIVQLHHGMLRIDSRVREGTTVTVTVPASPA